MKQFKLPNDLAEAGYRSSVRVMEPELKPPDNSALEIALKEIAARIEKAKTVTVAELRMVDDSIRRGVGERGDIQGLKIICVRFFNSFRHTGEAGIQSDR